jgi:DMSO/TMAO reductase YedYZ molybdopterin-dependent catalytic subunit
VADSSDPTDLTLTLKQIQSLPHVEQTTELFCIEGWSIVQKWKGVRFKDFVAKYPPTTQDGSEPDAVNHPEKLVPYVGMETPDGGYYVGLDMASALHPQTLLCWEMNGKPLALEHGAPLRLVIPTKYGVKNIKRIGTITYSTDKPKDYWAEQGYDWYCGL